MSTTPGAGPERTPDGRYLLINGRRWRASDPTIPEKLRGELVEELMSARRAVQAGGADQAAVRRARDRVQDAKVALGERGEPWWDIPSEDGLCARLASAMRALLQHRQPESTICPSDAARVSGGKDWRDSMDAARAVASELAAANVIEVRQKGRRLDPASATGAIRLARGPQFPGH